MLCAQCLEPSDDDVCVECASGHAGYDIIAAEKRASDRYDIEAIPLPCVGELKVYLVTWPDSLSPGDGAGTLTLCKRCRNELVARRYTVQEAIDQTPKNRCAEVS